MPRRGDGSPVGNRASKRRDPGSPVRLEACHPRADCPGRFAPQPPHGRRWGVRPIVAARAVDAKARRPATPQLAGRPVLGGCA
eukprot:8000476-Alexandrium_andersonii.AAC.1